MASVEIVQFRKSYDSKVVHSDVSFKVKRGECLGLLGGSGAGKSVILRSLIGLERPDSGQIFIDGEDITKLTEREMVRIRKKVAYASQGGALFDSMTVFDNLAYPLREHTLLNEIETKVQVTNLLKDFGLEGTENLLPHELSGGMQKRIGIARAIILQPNIILYDEPTAGLDPANTKNIQQLILKLKAQGTTSILVTHDMPTALAVCENICLLHKGKIKDQISVKNMVSADNSWITQFINGTLT